MLTCPKGFLCDTEASHCQLNPQLPEEMCEAHEMRGIVTFWTDDELEYGEVWGTCRRDGDLQQGMLPEGQISMPLLNYDTTPEGNC